MSEQRIVIEINPDGSIIAETDGFKGDLCIKALQDILGKDEFFCSIKPSDEFYQETKVVEDTTVKAGRS